MVFIDKDTKVIVQGMTGKHGSFHADRMLKFGTKIVAGVTPGKGGQEVHGLPVFDTIKEALKKHKAEWSCIFVPAVFAKDAALEALSAGLNVVMITENLPVHDTLEIIALAKKKKRMLLGPNCPGLVMPGQSKIGIIPNHLCKPGNIGIVSRSGTLTYEIINSLSKEGIGQSAIVGIGGDPVAGTDFIDVLKEFEKDKKTKKIVLIGEIGGDSEENAANYIKKNVSKPVVAYIAGRTAPEGKRMGHAGAIISGKAGTVEAKVESLEKAGVKVAKIPSQILKLLK
ncbi:succinate--CoA ligase subunit alpha [Thermoproteota archaeon]